MAAEKPYPVKKTAVSKGDLDRVTYLSSWYLSNYYPPVRSLSESASDDRGLR